MATVKVAGDKTWHAEAAKNVKVSPLTGLRVLVVEDEMLVSLLIEEVLADFDCSVIGPFGTLAPALEAARSERIDLAVLDVNIGGAKVYPVAEMLDARQVPFVFLSGYGQHAVPNGKPHWRVCSKPFMPDDLIAMLERLAVHE